MARVRQKWYSSRQRIVAVMLDEMFLTTDEVLEYLQVNPRTVRRIKAAKTPAVRVGRQWRFRKPDIDAANLGVSGYLTKPVKVPKVLAVAARALGE